MKNKTLFVYFPSFFLFILLVGLFISPYLQAEVIGHTEEAAVNVYDEDSNYIFGSAMGIVKGDRYIDENNQEYVIEEVNGQRAIAKNLGKVDLLEGITTEVSLITPLAAEGKKIVGLYYTHNGESYLPGPENIQGRGEIHNIGETFKKALERNGIRVVVSDNLHLPHDGAAYERSRATALSLMKQRPDAIFDVHRDAIPRKEEYLKEVDGKLVSQVRLVVGRQSQNRKVIDKFAKQLKAITDKRAPGLIKGIFYGSGAYNQEVSPRSLLFEFGTHVTTKEQAQASVALFADSINQLLYGENAEARSAGENRSSATTIGWIVGILAVAILSYLFINEGSWNGVTRRIKQFFGREIIDRGDE